MNITRLRFLVAAMALTSGVHAMDLRPQGVFAVAAVAENDSYAANLGLLWPWAWRGELGHGELTAVTEGYLSQWSARRNGGRASFSQLGLLPVLRLQSADGSSPWFAEAGIGVTLMNRIYRTQTKTFSTRFNFVDVIGIGLGFGTQRHQELGLRLAHLSNGFIKKPNPGENFLQLRYAVMF
jgi:lipid A 3-O-deacylase